MIIRHLLVVEKHRIAFKRRLSAFNKKFHREILQFVEIRLANHKSLAADYPRHPILISRKNRIVDLCHSPSAARPRHFKHSGIKFLYSGSGFCQRMAHFWHSRDVNTFGIKPVDTPEADLKAILD